MKIIFYLLILVLCSANLLTAQNQKTNFKNRSTISPEASRIIDEQTRFKSDKDSGAIILFREAEMSVKENQSFEVCYHVIGKIFDNEAKSDYSQIPVFFNSYYEEVTLDFARTIDFDKSFTNISKDAIQIKTYPDYYGSINYTDTKILAFSLPALGKGKIFEYQITVITKKPIIKNYWFETFCFNLVLYNLNNPHYIRVDSVLTSRFILSVPEGTKFQSEFSTVDVESDKKTKNKIDTYLWEAVNLPPIIIEEGMPYLYEVTPNITVSSLFDWKDFGNWIYSDINKRIKVNDEIKFKADELVLKSISKGDKIEALYDFVRKEINYIQADLDRGGLIPHYSNEILRNKYGDCKDQVNLLISLLKAEGIQAFPALISTFSYRDHHKYIPTQYFDHMIVYIPTNRKNIWLDPTTEINEFPSLHWSNQDRWALVLDEQGGNFIKTPNSNPENNLGKFNIIFKAHKESLKGRVELLSRGAIMETLSSYLNRYSKYEQDYLFRDLLEYYYASISVIDVNMLEARNQNDFYSQVINFEYLESTEEFWQFSYASSIPLAFSAFFVELPLFEEGQNRRYDYKFPCKFSLKGTEVFHSPWGHSTDIDIPKSDSLITGHFSFYQKFRNYEDSVMVNWTFTLHDDQISVDQISLFNADVKKLDKMLLWEIIFYKGSGYFLRKIPYSTKVIFILLLIIFGTFSLVMFIDAYKKEPKDTNWIWLAVILATGPFGSTVYYFSKKRPRTKLKNAAVEDLYCSECGDKVDPDDKYCPNCGSGFDENITNLTEEKKISVVPEWVWFLYPIFILAISYVSNIRHFVDGNVAGNVGRVIGTAIWYSIIPLLVLGIRKLFKMKKLSGRVKAILFYGISLALFTLTMCGQLIKN